MVIKMADVIKFKEPERCDYLYIDENNKVHLLMPIVGGDEIGLDNTCQTAVELRSFFYGNTHHGEARHSAEQQLADYKKQLEEDIQAINSQKGISRYAYTDLLKEKKERLKQIEKYIELIKVLKEEYDHSGEIITIKNNIIPPLPSGLNQIIQSSENAGAVRLCPDRPDLATSFKNPLFRLNRHYENSDHKLTEGLGVRLGSTLLPDSQTPTPINRKSPKEKIVETVLAKFKSEKIAEPNREEKLQELKTLLQEELVKIDSNLSVDISHDEKETNYGYLEMMMGMDEDSSIQEWIDSILTATVDSSVWDTQSSSPFYDGAKEIKHKEDADKMSIRVQYLLAEINFYCKTNKLSEANFGEFFDKEPHATEIAKKVKEGLVNGDDIEPIIYNYINSKHAELGLESPLTTKQQQEIADKFAQHYNTIKASPHFDEFFIADPDKKGNIFTHQGRLSCHFLDFFARQTNAKHLLGELEGHVEALQEGTSNRLNHKNEIVAEGYEKIEKFKQEVVRLLAENKPKELLDYLTATSPTGVPNYSLLSLETQNYISYNRNWPAIERELQKSENIQPNIKQDLLRLLSRDNVQHDNLSAITWSKYSSKPLLEVELSKIAEGLNATADIYEEKRKQQWYKGSRNDAREDQCAELKKVAEEINTLLDNSSLSKGEVLNTLLKSIETLDKIDDEISSEFNLFQSTLQKEVGLFREQLKDICQLDNYAFKSTKLGEIISLEMEEQFQKIKDPTVQQIVRDLPSHCHNDEAIDFFKTLNPEEAAKVASYLSLEYREINKSTDKKTLLEQDIPNLFKEVNMQLLSKLKEDSVLAEGVYEKLAQLADKIPPEHFTRNNIRKWSANPEKLEESNLGELLKSSDGSLTEMARKYKETINEMTGRNEPPKETVKHTI
ncbi:TPA: protein SdcA [Legionella pneumophila]|nr:protein SdcA [Legionella pneumophila]HAU1321816.1 protein SdcA [Legionella pneumophila]HBC0468489.1 protein SdcA [Legionella pneumophila]HBD9375457.1 protein SdcA [Legionella pneumophila]HBI2947447.1 protein SdcA [Legionella pneumophila]